LSLANQSQQGRAAAAALNQAKPSTNQNGGALAPAVFLFPPCQAGAADPDPRVHHCFEDGILRKNKKSGETKASAAVIFFACTFAENQQSAQQLQHALLRTWLAERRGAGYRDRLPGRQRLAVGPLPRWRSAEASGWIETGLQHIDQLLGEVLADLHDRQVGAETLRPCERRRDAGSVERGQDLAGQGRCPVKSVPVVSEARAEDRSD